MQQEITLGYDDLLTFEAPRGTSLRERSQEWMKTCFPQITLEVPSSVSDHFTIETSNEEQVTFYVENLASGTIFVTRDTLVKSSLNFQKQIQFDLHLAPQLASQYSVGYQNTAPTITDPAPENDAIYVSIQWDASTAQVSDDPVEETGLINDVKRPFLIDIDGNDRDIIFLSGPIYDKEGDKPSLRQIDLTFQFTVELTEENRVMIKMARPMRKSYLGVHDFRFALSDDGSVTGLEHVYKVSIALGSYLPASEETIESIEEPIEENQLTLISPIDTFAGVPLD